MFSIRSDGDPLRFNGCDGGHHRVGGCVDHRDIEGFKIRDIDVFAVRGHRDPIGFVPHRGPGATTVLVSLFA